MPRVKFEYVVSFSSEDPEHPASNLLSWEVSKKKWLCAAGETSASVVLQLEKAVQIGSVSVGAHHAALVEVLVGRSETPAHPYQVLVASSVFLSPTESRKAEGAGAERVRSFSAAGGAGEGAGVWAQRWDRLRLVISQPYNKHCKFGVSFVHVFTPETAPAPVSAPALASLSELEELEEEEFKPGELFAQHKLQADATSDTGSQIRRATSQVLRAAGAGAGASDARLVRRPLPATATDHNRRKRAASATPAPTPAPTPTRDRGTPHESNKRSSNDRDKATEIGAGTSRPPTDNDSATSRDTREKRERRDKHRDTSRDRSKDNGETTKTDHPLEQKRRVEVEVEAAGQAQAQAVLEGVVCVLSGYANPERARVRATALALGARVARHWGPACTHLICAFPNTPKLSEVRRGAGGARVPAVTARWLDECARRRTRLPEEWYSTEPERRVAPPPGSLDTDHSEDTDDEIERVLRLRRPSSARDEDDHRRDRIQGSVSDRSDEGTTDGEGDERGRDRPCIEASHALPPLLRDMLFVPSPTAAGPLLDRYVRAYGGTILPVEEVESSGREGAVFALCEGGGAGASTGAGARRLHPRWLWRVHEDRRLPPLGAYLIDS